MIECLLVDDEAPARQQMRRLLRPHVDVHVIGEATDGLDALQQMADSRPDVVFLDIEMPRLDGFGVAAACSRLPVVVFVTAYDQYAVKAFEANAIDYLLKPVMPARLAQALTRVRETLAHGEARARSMRSLLTTVRAGVPEKLVAQRGKRLVLLSPGDIVYAVAEDKLVFLHTRTDRFLTDRTIAELEQLLAPAGFFRISRAALVNLKHAAELVPWSSRTWKLKLSTNVELGVSRERGRLLQARFK